jgi:hypothetical protein
MAKKQFVEGALKHCQRSSCKNTCCDDDQVEEWVNEYFAFHERIKDYLLSLGIKIFFKGDRVFFKNCSDGKNCKFLKYSLNKDIDPRPIDCKIYPYEVDWDTFDSGKKIVTLHYWDNDCPLVRKNAIPEKFKKEVEYIIKRDFAVLFYGSKFEVKFKNKVHK